MKTKLLVLCLLLTGGLLLWLQIPAAASPNPQTQYATPTALPDGRIIYVVQPGDTCTRISLLTGVSVDYLRTTNQLNENCDIREGQQLLIGVGGPAAVSPTPGPSPTPAPTQPTPTPGAGGTAVVCVLMYDDLNGDGLRQETEFGVDGGAVSLVSANGQYSQTQNTTSAHDPDDAEEPLRQCFKDLQPGTYTVSGGVPTGYNPTTALNTTVEVVPGDTTYVDFGAQVQTVSEDDGGQGTSPLLGIIGAILLLGGVGLGIYAWMILRKK
jgi:LysM repeat protein